MADIERVKELKFIALVSICRFLVSFKYLAFTLNAPLKILSLLVERLTIKTQKCIVDVIFKNTDSKALDGKAIYITDLLKSRLLSRLVRANSNQKILKALLMSFEQNIYGETLDYESVVDCANTASLQPCRLGQYNTLTVSLHRSKIPPRNEYTVYDIKLFDGQALVMLELWEIWWTPSLPWLPGPLGPGVVAL